MSLQASTLKASGDMTKLAKELIAKTLKEPELYMRRDLLLKRLKATPHAHAFGLPQRSNAKHVVLSISKHMLVHTWLMWLRQTSAVVGVIILSWRPVVVHHMAYVI